MLISSVTGNNFGIEVVEGSSKALSLAQDSDPAEPCLESIQNNELEVSVIIMNGHSPFFIVVSDFDGV